MKLPTLAVILALATPLHAGGPVIVEDMTETAPMPERNNWVVPVIIGLLVIGALASSGGDDAPVTPGPDPKPEPCVKNGEGC
jgi:hypothetical protein